MIAIATHEFSTLSSEGKILSKLKESLDIK